MSECDRKMTWHELAHEHTRQKKEIEQLRMLIRCEQITPPADVTDDQTTELAVELACAKQQIEQLKEENFRLWRQSQAKEQQIKQLRELNQRLQFEVQSLTKSRDHYMAEVERLRAGLQRIADMDTTGRLSGSVFARQILEGRKVSDGQVQ